jgi:hypothetical protein
MRGTELDSTLGHFGLPLPHSEWMLHSDGFIDTPSTLMVHRWLGYGQ